MYAFFRAITVWSFIVCVLTRCVCADIADVERDYLIPFRLFPSMSNVCFYIGLLTMLITVYFPQYMVLASRFFTSNTILFDLGDFPK